MTEPFQTQKIARFALSGFEDLPPDITDQLKKHLLDSVGSLLHSLNQSSVKKLIRQFRDLGDSGKCTVPVLGGLALDRAAQFYTALIRYPDFMDNFLGKEATCHPCDNIGGLLAAGQVANTQGKDFLLAMAIGYAIECTLVEEIPVMKEGFDHTLLLGYSLAASVGRLLRLDEAQLAHAIAMTGCTVNPIVTCRASYTYEWKGFTSSMVASDCINIVMLAKEGMTGPLSLFEGPRGFSDIFSMNLEHDWSAADFDIIRRCILKQFNAEVHGQSALETATSLKKKHGFSAADIQSVDVTTFLTCYRIIGGGAYGDRHNVQSKEQADHSLPYVLAVLLIDDEVYPEQFNEQRILKSDVQELLKKVKIKTMVPFHEPAQVAGALDPYTVVYPRKMKAKVVITLNNGDQFEGEQDDYHGFFTRPLGWEEVIKKFHRLASENAGDELRDQIIAAIRDMENHPVAHLTNLLAKAGN
jgi:2-methylcitrate dehydratase